MVQSNPEARLPILERPWTRNEISAFINSALGITYSHTNKVAMFNGHFGMYESDLARNQDFHFVPLAMRSSDQKKKDILLHNRQQIYLIDLETQQDRYNNDRIIHVPEKKLYNFPPDMVKVIWIEGEVYNNATYASMFDNQPSDTPDDSADDIDAILESFSTEQSVKYPGLTVRDEICLDKNVPLADTEWVNMIIQRHNNPRAQVNQINEQTKLPF